MPCHVSMMVINLFLDVASNLQSVNLNFKVLNVLALRCMSCMMHLAHFMQFVMNLIAYAQCGLIVIRLENVHSTWRCNGIPHCFIFNQVNFMSLKYWWLKLTYLWACVWLEEILKKIDYLLIVVSLQDFTNGVCTNIIPTKHEQLNF